MLFNQATRQLLLRKLPRRAYSHDWWLYMVVSAFGEIVFDPESRILYRQHPQNVFGAAPSADNLYQYSIKELSLQLNQWQQRIHRFLTEGAQRRVMQQAEEFQQIYASLLCSEYQQILETLLDSQTSLRKRLGNALHKLVYRQSPVDDLILRLLIAWDRL